LEHEPAVEAGRWFNQQTPTLNLKAFLQVSQVGEHVTFGKPGRLGKGPERKGLRREKLLQTFAVTLQATGRRVRSRHTEASRYQ
jgi:hypothetical protein